MGLGDRILKNTTYLTLGDKVGYLIQFIFFLYFARKFGVAPTGEYSFGFSFTYAFAVLADLGISIYLVREIARDYSAGRQLFLDCLVLRTILLMLVFILACAILAVFFGDISVQKLKVIVFWGGYWIFYSFADVFVAELNGHEKMAQVAILGIMLKVISSAAGAFLIYLGMDYVVVLIVLPLSSFIYLCACIFVSLYYLGSIPKTFSNFSLYKSLFRKLLPFFFTVLLVEILWCQDIIILGIIQDDEAVGIYSASIKIVAFILGISPFFHIAMLPVLSRLYMESREKLVEISNRILKYLFLLSLPLSVGLAMTAGKIIDLLYSDFFQNADVVLKIASWAIAAGLIQAIFSVLLTAINRQKEKVLFIGANFVISTLLNILLIYYFSYVGAAVVKVITAFLGLIFFVYLVAKFLRSLSILRFLLRPALACLIMATFIHLFSQWALIYLVPISGIIYLASLFLLGSFTEEEFRYVRNLVPRRV